MFCRTKDGVERLAGKLSADGLTVSSLRGNMTQPERERVMRAFRLGRPNILVATNVAARGLDVAHIARVVNFDLPDSPELLTHRIGRTGRMGRSGEAITFVTPRDRKAWAAMQARLSLKVIVLTWKPGFYVRDNGNVAPTSDRRSRGSNKTVPNGLAPVAEKRPATVPDSAKSGAKVGATYGQASNGHAASAGSQASNGHGANGRSAQSSNRHDSHEGTRQTSNRPSRDRQSRNGRPVPMPSSGNLNDAVCDGCGAAVRIAWKPTPNRPAYCQECRELVSVAV